MGLASAGLLLLKVAVKLLLVDFETPTQCWDSGHFLWTASASFLFSEFDYVAPVLVDSKGRGFEGNYYTIGYQSW